MSHGWGIMTLCTPFSIALSVAVLQMRLALALVVNALATGAQQRLTLFVRHARLINSGCCRRNYSNDINCVVFNIFSYIPAGKHLSPTCTKSGLHAHRPSVAQTVFSGAHWSSAWQSAVTPAAQVSASVGTYVVRHTHCWTLSSQTVSGVWVAQSAVAVHWAPRPRRGTHSCRTESSLAYGWQVHTRVPGGALTPGQKAAPNGEH